MVVEDPKQTGEEKETGRIEAFSDGVFAIAITLLILEVKVPRDLTEGKTLESELLKQWPSYVAFLISFAFIGIMWVNHHRLFSVIKRAGDGLLFANTLLLLGVTVVPFPTQLVADYFGHEGEQTAALVYSGWFAIIAIFFNILWWWASYKNRLLDKNADRQLVRTISQRYALGPFLYLLAFGLAFINVPASLILNFVLAIFFALPSKLQKQLADS